MPQNSLSDNVDPLEAILDHDELLDYLVQEAVQDALQEHKRKGEPIVVWRDGKVVTLTADEIPERAPVQPPLATAPPSADQRG